MSGHLRTSSVVTERADAGCPLCGHCGRRRSWLGSTFYRAQEFTYAECLHCGSHYCAPMPDAQVLRHMYGPQYWEEFPEDGGSAEDPREPERVIRWLERSQPGRFVDFGCGDGRLLIEARNRGWEAIGVELDREVAEEVARKTGATVLTTEMILSGDKGWADLLHLGDVIEHMTAVGLQMPGILELLRPGGLLIAQGPLEANQNLFIFGLRIARRLRNTPRTEMAPYHVILATADGQKRLFARFGLEEVEFAVREVWWPAPSCVSGKALSFRSLALFLLRRISMLISTFHPGAWGNRYFYVGTLRTHGERFLAPA